MYINIEHIKYINYIITNTYKLYNHQTPTKYQGRSTQHCNNLHGNRIQRWTDICMKNWSESVHPENHNTLIKFTPIKNIK